jgi:hypothetical protein
MKSEIQNPKPETKSPPPDEMEILAEMTFDIAAAEAGEGGENGEKRLPTFKMLAYTGGPMVVGGFTLPVVVDLAGLTVPRETIAARLDHWQRVGHTTKVSLTESKIEAEGVISCTSDAAAELVADAKNGFPWQASIGASVQEYEVVKQGQSIVANGKTHKGPIILVRKSTLGEISFVDAGADSGTSARVAARQQGGKTMKVDKKPGEQPNEEVNPNVNGDEGQPKEVQARQPQPKGVTEPQDQPKGEGAQTPAESMRIEAAAEQERIIAVRKVCGDKHPEICAKAINEGWDSTRSELEVLRADRPKAPAAHTRDSDVQAGSVLEAAAMISAGKKGDDVVKVYGAETVDEASKRFRGGVGLQELLLEAAWANGYDGRSFRDTRAILQHAFAPQVQAGFSSVDISGILSNVANKFLLEGFFLVEKVWRNICGVRSVRDFKQITSYRLTGSDQYEKVGPDGELKHGTLGNESYTNQADTYGLMLQITRQDIINDDLGAITTVPRKLGRGAGLKINDVFWTAFLDNATFFTVARGNYLSGAGSALGIDGLTDAEVAFYGMTDADGKPVGAMPAILLVPPALGATASVLEKSAEVRNTTASTKYPVANPHAGKFRTEISRYLANASYTGYSAAKWYLLADPMDAPVIEVAFLNGQESPTIEQADADFNVLGVKMRGYHDFGVAKQDYRGGVANNGS